MMHGVRRDLHQKLVREVYGLRVYIPFVFSSRRWHTRCLSDWSSDVCSSDLLTTKAGRETSGSEGKPGQMDRRTQRVPRPILLTTKAGRETSGSGGKPGQMDRRTQRVPRPVLLTTKAGRETSGSGGKL